MEGTDTNTTRGVSPIEPYVEYRLTDPVEGDYTYKCDCFGGVLVVFARTGSRCVFRVGDKIFDRKKRGDSSYWYDVAITLHGFTYPNGERVKDVLSYKRVVLESGRCVSLDYQGVRRTARKRYMAAYYRYRDISKKPERIRPEWLDYEVFEAWFKKNRPSDKKRWALRTVTGYYGPYECGFDNRVDLPCRGLTVVDGVIQRP